MWKSNKPDERPATPATPAPSVPTPTLRETRTMDSLRSDSLKSEVAHIGKSVLIKGELTGSEDLFLDGEVEGNIDLKDHSLTIGPNGKIRANVVARDVVVHGKVDGNVSGTERVELKRSAVLVGDIATQRIVIEDGAYFKGAIDIRKEAAKPARTEIAKPASSSMMSSPASTVSQL